MVAQFIKFPVICLRTVNFTKTNFEQFKKELQSALNKLAVNKQIKEAENLQLRDELIDELSYRNTKTPKNAKVIANYETKDAYITEYFQATDSGYTPPFRRISIDKTSNELVFEDIDK